MNAWKKLLNVNPKISPVEYSDIVDRSDFRFSDDTSMISRLSEMNTGSYTGVYDYEGEVPPFDKDPVTPLVVDLRQNLLNRGEIDDIHRAQVYNASKDAENIMNRKIKERKQKESDTRNAAIDSALGISSE